MKKLTVKIKNISLDREVTMVSFGSLDRGNVSDLTNWGCFSNTGSIEFFDTNMGTAESFETVMSYAPNATVRIYYNSGNIEKLLATFLIDDYEINYETKKVSLKLKDNLVAWQEQNIDEYYEFYQKSLYDIWNATFSGETKIKSSAENLMRQTNIEISYMEKSNKWANIDKICQASMTRCFCDADGTPIISDETPRSGELFSIRPRNILSIENKTSNRNTKVEDVTISAYNYTRRLNEPITNELPFAWYNVIGKDYQNVSNKTILAEWADYFVNVSSIGRIPPCGAYVSARIPKSKDHIFNVTKALARTNVVAFKGQLSSTSRTLQSTDIGLVAEIPGISGQTPSLAHDLGDSIYIYYRETQAIESYNADDPTRVGGFCTEGGSLIGRGNFFTEDGSQSFGSDSEYATQLASNELIQVLSTFGDNPLAQHIIDTVNEKYSNGVECVVMEVTPSEYQGEEGLAIDPIGQKPLFEKYDIVVPYVIRNGREQPYSTTSDGSPKSFKVVGIEYSYSGLLRQKLHLQENKD